LPRDDARGLTQRVVVDPVELEAIVKDLQAQRLAAVLTDDRRVGGGETWILAAGAPRRRWDDRLIWLKARR
jgi:hypothetical protein